MADRHYPRPDMERDRWLSLDGTWEFEFDDKGCNPGGKTLAGTITVTFCIESEASGIGVQDPPPVSWYAKNFRRKDLPPGKRFFLNFGAVDYEATVWLNGALLGSHRGGYTPFTFEITERLADNNRLIVRASDPRTRGTLRGKQYLWKKLSPIFYTPASGIWQPVYIFSTGSSSIVKLGISSAMDAITVSWDIDGGDRMIIEIAGAKGRIVNRKEIRKPQKNGSATLVIKRPHLWSVVDPYLYTVTVSLHDAVGKSDRVVSRAGLRGIEVKNGSVVLNGNPIRLKMLLVQGYFPGGHYSPVDGEAGFERDIMLVKRMGFNGIRMHQKIEDPRFLHLCDRHGLLVWTELPSPFLFSPVNERQYENELWDVLDRDSGHASNMAVVLFNETWGIFDILWSGKRKKYIRDLYARVKGRCPQLLVVDNSGYDHILTDIADIHHYLTDDAKIRKLYECLGDRGKMTMRFLKVPRAIAYLILTHKFSRKPYLSGGTYRGFEPFMVSEFGGAGFYKTDKGMLESFADNVRIMKECPRLAGYCLTQAYDVEGEQNGLISYDRKAKYDIEEIARINAIIP